PHPDHQQRLNKTARWPTIEPIRPARFQPLPTLGPPSCIGGNSQSGLACFAAGLIPDLDAVVFGMSTDWWRAVGAVDSKLAV
ncbi:hypothetical protein ACWEQL_39445, partial [Kitasatospora sp. NPDC004240]